ncbi:Ig-like domain-containing protein [Costertonia aggregata]|uniref:Ig-like domain-containing protein n=1 Tax=Costertonia aggregata TaxID=343403 RepID=A0A7H9ATL3_9FLAO|nr:RHS repeat-associated core domain-containing protein [Costertonia aggregata]QLG46780.1 hypothetical protein HYG79_15950 [Costertonia aggregata]
MKDRPISLQIILIVISFLTCASVFAQGSISGPSSTDVGDTENYFASYSGPGSVINTQWYVSNVSYTVVSGQSSQNASIKFNSVGSGIVRATVLNSSFSSTYLTKNVTVNGSVVGQVSITSGLTSRCKGGGTSDYNASASNANSYAWTITPSGAGSISSSGLVSWNSSFSGVATVQVTAYGNNNSSSTAQRNVTVTALPSLSVNDASNSCSSSSITLSAISPSISSNDTNIEHRWYTSATGSGYITGTKDPNAPIYITQVTVTGQNKDYWVSARYNNCETARQKVSASYTANTTPTLSVFNITGEQCGPSATFNLNAGGGSSGSVYQWYETPGGTIPIHTGSNFAPTLSTYGEKTYYVGGTLKNALGCTFNISLQNRLPITIKVNRLPGSAIANDPLPRYCAGNFTLRANPGTNGNTVRWYSSPTGGQILGTGTTFSTGSLGSGTYSYYAESYNSTTYCVADSRTKVTAIVNEGDIPLSVNDASNSCSSSSITLSAISPSISSNDTNIEHRWYTSATGSGYITGTKDPNAPIYITQVTVTGQNKDYWVSARYNNCETARQKVSASYTANTTPTLSVFNITGEQCGPSATFNLNAGGGSSGSVYQWYETPGGTIPIHTGSNFAPTLSTYGEKTYYVGGTLKNALGCTFNISLQNRLPITIKVNRLPGSAIANDPLPRYCAGNFTLRANPGTNGNTVRWYSSPTGGQILGTGTTFSTGSLGSGTYSYYAESYNSTTYCVADSRTKVTAIVNEGDISLDVNDASNSCFSSDIVLSAISFDVNADDPNIQHRWYTTETGNTYVTGTKEPNAPIFITQVTVPGQNKDYWVSALYGACETTRQKVSATYTANVTPSLSLYNAFNEQDQCGSNTTMQLYAGGGSTGSIYRWFNTPSGVTPIYEGSNFSPTVNYQNTNNGQVTYYVRATLKNSLGCSFNTQDQITITLDPPMATSILWYPDSDGDTMGDVYGTPYYGCTAPDYGDGINWVTNNNDLCPYDFGTVQNNGCPPGQEPENRNTITTWAYDLNGQVKASSKSYFDELGKMEQTQAWDVKSDSIWASATLYDEYGRLSLQTLSAPIREGLVYQYKDNLILKEDNNGNYDLTDYDGSNRETPNPVGDAPTTLGWYYSENNSREPYQDITQYPFTKSVYSDLNPGTVLRSVGGNKINGKWPQAYAFTMKASRELSQVPAFGEIKYNTMEITKTVTRDVHGVENVVFMDTDGKVLAAARSGSEGITSPQMSVSIPEQGFVDIHVPEGIIGFTVSNSGAVSVYDLITEDPIYTSTSGLGNGFYRVAVNNLGSYVPESISVSYSINYYDYSLNEYDEANRLITSYQPLGVTKATKLKSSYEYNTVGQLLYTTSPDEGEAWFKYREDGQIRFSQNSKQRLEATPAEFSYTNYDTYGRPVESGVFIEGSVTFTNADNLLENTLDDITADNDGLPNTNCKEQTFTLYDQQDTAGLHAALTASGIASGYYTVQKFVNGNVSKTFTVDADVATTSWYSYDVYGRVDWVVQQIAGLGAKTIDYTYDPITGQVLRVDYQKDTPSERFVHRYTYNESDQLVKVETATDGIDFTTHADYTYYETGAMKRTELAGGVQGIDYVYNLAGQLKSLNHPSLQNTNDPGGDANDLFGMQLDYHNNDYQRTSRTNITPQAYGQNQLNGNIKGMRWKNNAVPGATGELMYAYDYDRNNWLESADFDGTGTLANGVQADETSNTVVQSGQTLDIEATNSITLLPDFHAQTGSTVNLTIVADSGSGTAISSGDYDVSNITYDANGNILSLRRNKNTINNSNGMDDLAYSYKNGTNQLLQVQDAEGDAPNADDIDTQTETANYDYNAIGQLIENKAEGITYEYNTAGLVTRIKKNGLSLITFFYNDRNHRVRKDTYAGNGVEVVQTTHYVRDVAGSVMGIYTNNVLNEQPVYGANRLAVFYRQSNTSVYELTDHLGNVRAGFAKAGNTADTRSGTDYYPFGMAMPGRSLTGSYRYTFQGQEKDPETGKEAFELRLWDSRIGRWLTTDPYGQYASPYLGMGNNPISLIDRDGGFADCPDCPGGTYENGTEHIGSDGQTYIYDNFFGGWSDGANVNITATQNVGKAQSYALATTLMARATVTAEGAALFDGPSPLGDMSGGVAWGLTALTAAAIVLPEVFEDDYTYTATPDNGGYLTLYRGVAANHPDYTNALNGIATPRALMPVGHNSPDAHNGGNTLSIFTSWTLSRSVADYHATKAHPYLGVVLVKRFRLTQTVPSPDNFSELEMLVPGVVKGAQVTKPLGFGTRTAY